MSFSYLISKATFVFLPKCKDSSCRYIKLVISICFYFFASKNCNIGVAVIGIPTIDMPIAGILVVVIFLFNQSLANFAFSIMKILM